MRRRVGLLLAIALVAGLAGCGAVEDTASTATPETDSPTPGAEPAVTPTDRPDGGTTTETRESTPTGAGSPAATDDGESGGGSEDGDGGDAEDDGFDGSGEGGEDGGEGRMVVHHVNVGQAEATLIEMPAGETVLIDSGDWRDDGETVIDYLEARGVERIDHLVATHAHADHIGGHAAVIEHYETENDGIGRAWDSGVPHSSQTYEDYLDAVDEHDVDLIEAREGDEIPVENATVELFNPPADDDSDDQDYNSVTLRVEYGDASFLFTGDAGADAERRMVDEHGVRLNADVFHAGHHGSRESSSDRMIEAVEPQFTVISSAYDSQYGHPHNETLRRFADREVDAYWTGTHGTVVAATDGDAIVVGTHHDAPTDPGELKAGEEATADPADPVEERERYRAQNAEGAEFGYAAQAAATAGANLLFLVLVGRKVD